MATIAVYSHHRLVCTFASLWELLIWHKKDCDCPCVCDLSPNKSVSRLFHHLIYSFSFIHLIFTNKNYFSSIFFVARRVNHLFSKITTDCQQASKHLFVIDWLIDWFNLLHFIYVCTCMRFFNLLFINLLCTNRLHWWVNEWTQIDLFFLFFLFILVIVVNNFCFYLSLLCVSIYLVLLSYSLDGKAICKLQSKIGIASKVVDKMGMPVHKTVHILAFCHS